MYALATPGLLYVAPHFGADMPTPYVPLEKTRGGILSTGGGNIASAECSFPEEEGVAEAGGNPTLLGECSPSEGGVGPSADGASLPPLRVGFVSRFFGDEVRRTLLAGSLCQTPLQ